MGGTPVHAFDETVGGQIHPATTANPSTTQESIGFDVPQRRTQGVGVPAMSTATLEGLRVLVVEDEMMVSMLIEDMLSDLGCTVVGPASRLDEAMELAREAELDCAVLDVNLGGQQIFPLADLLREKGAPFAFATGYGDAGLRDVDRGSPVLQKPFREGDLARVLGELRARN